MPENAAELRSRIQALRKSLDPSERARIQKRIDIQLFGLLRDRLRPAAGRCWGLHRPLPWEWSLPVSTGFLRESGVALVYPRMRDPADRSQGMSWHLADESIPAHWEACRGMPLLLEPRGDLPEIDPARMDGVWVPGVAFSERGERMGTGGGFYDFFLARHPSLVRVAGAADFQLLRELPGQRPDEPRMSHIAGEERVLSFTDDGN